MQINVKLGDDEEMFLYLKRKGNYSEYIRDLINQDRISKLDSKYIAIQRKKLKEQLKDLDNLEVQAKELKKQSQEDSERVEQILQTARDHFQEIKSDPTLTPGSFRMYLRNNIIPKLKEAKCTRYDVDQLAEMIRGF